ncbi:uncharacterized protein LOC121929034 [Sceloporus undulatus]|uniref:uncharacterized protein LOC121929034 n=1 Tax=Sceloporus undulatus TaxID=8520 RepID=UPI001C4B112B|nr:uncharacterized protein LOC121929034 [Sceloporus undulatus]
MGFGRPEPPSSDAGGGIKSRMQEYYNFNGKVPHVTYDYTVPRTLSPALQTVSPIFKMSLHLHLPEPSHNHQEAVAPIPVDFNATWISLAPEGIGERFSQGEEHGGMGFKSQNFFPSNSSAQARDWDWKHRAEEERFGFQVRQVYHTNGAGEDEEVAASRETELDLRLNHITVSTVMPHGAARHQETSRIGPSRLRLFRKLCLQDPQNAAICRELHYLAIKLGRKNSTAVFWGDPLVEWPEGLHKQPPRKKFLEHVNAGVYAVDEATNDTTITSSSKPSSSSTFQLGFVNKHLSEPHQGPSTER